MRAPSATTTSPVNTAIALEDWSQPKPFFTKVPPLSSEREESAALEPNISKIVIICMIFMISRVNKEGSVVVRAEDTEYGKMLKLTSESDNDVEIRGLYDFCRYYPAVSVVASFLRSLCNEKGIELMLSCRDGEASVFAVFPRADLKEFSVLNRITEEALIKIYGVLAEIFDTV